MKFSYQLIKKLVPQAKNKADLIEKLNLHSFEAADAGGDVIDIILPPNRYDAASHWGIAREISAVLGKSLKFSSSILRKTEDVPFKIEIKDKNLCPRYAAQYFENVRIAPSPKWMQDILKSCGMRPINNVVDIMNYAMLETGEPMHAFDFDKLSQSANRKAQIVVRKAKKPARNASHSDAGGGERITTLDNQKFDLNENNLVIANDKNVLAIAGIKGGKKAEVDNKTKRIIIEAANFDAGNIYKTSKSLNLSTDASIRFSRNISPYLVEIGISRAAELLKEITGARVGGLIDVYSKKQPKVIIKFDVERFKNFIGIDLDIKIIKNYLILLGFIITQNSKLPPAPRLRRAGKTQNSFLVEAPAVRTDIETFEDVAEEIIRLYGYNRLKSQPPRIHLAPSGFEDQIVLENKIKRILVGFGLDEVFNYSFVSSDTRFENADYKFVKLENPISAEFQYLRPSLFYNLIKNAESNARFFDEISVFETGKVFFKGGKSNGINEINSLGILSASKNKETFFKLKGIIEELFKRIGLVDYLFVPITDKDWVKNFTSCFLKSGEALKIESNGAALGYLGKIKNPKDLGKWHIGFAEMDIEEILKLVVEEHEYRPLSKYPSVMRDISILVGSDAKVGEITQTIQEADLKYIEDVDLIDEYEMALKRSLTFRIVFQAENRTLTDREINWEMDKITAVLKRKFKAETR